MYRLLETFVELAPAPYGHKQDDQMVSPYEEEFSGFVFKIQANMNPAHRDRIALSESVLEHSNEEWMSGWNVQIKLKLSNVTQFMADSRKRRKAVAGDIIGVYDTGNYQIGDTLFEGKLKLLMKNSLHLLQSCL